MGKVKTLIRIQLREFFSKYRWGIGINGKKPRKGYLLVTLCFLTIPFLQMSVEVYRYFNQWGRPDLGVAYLMMMTFLLMLFTAIPLLNSIFLYNDDYQILAPLPLPEDYLVLAKLSVVWVYTAGINLLLFLPVLFLIGLEKGGESFFFLCGLLLIILTPFLPLFLATLFVFGFTTFLANRGRKNLLSLLFGLVLLGLVLGAQLLMMGENPVRLLALTESLIRYYPPAGWAAQMINGSWLSIIYYLSLNGLCYFGLKALARRLYRSALLFSGIKRVKPKSNYVYRPRGKYRQLLRRNLLIIIRQPVFLMHTLLSSAVPILIFLVGFHSGDFTAERLSLFDQPRRFTLFWVGLASTPALLNNLSATAITREGKAFWETMVLPVTAWDNLRARINTTFLLNITASLLVMGTIMFSFSSQFPAVFSGFFFVAMLTWLLASTDLVINIYRPFLNWSNPAAAIKNNLNVLLSLAYRPLLSLIPLVVFRCFPEAGINRLLFTCGILFSFLTLLIRRYLYWVMLERFKRIGG
ncbi:MAG TPA: hypothetical protein GXZ98_09630 [Firmicutes bacterium]|jgi:ABC-2 type transport system permease protein|nr:hypothetical protein [Bacillota bacterium]